MTEVATPSLVDIGTNLTNKRFKADRRAMLERAHAAGVTRIVATGVSVQGSRDAVTLAEDLAAEAPQSRPLPAVFATAGIHPHHGAECDSLALATLRELHASPRCVAVGECGLDYNRNFSPPKAQRSAFAAQLSLAAELQKPVFLHEREAHADFVSILKDYRAALVGGVVHCFTSDRAALESYLELDLHIGITGWIADERRGQHLIELVRQIPADRLMIETDAPYILPRNMPSELQPKDRRNEAAFLPYVLRAVAAARAEPDFEVARCTTQTACKLFGLH
ncbi:MAG: TatD family hydrolase [Polyangiaceae bacterium]